MTTNITSKQRAFLRSQANKLEVVVHVGKSGVTSTVLKQVNDALAAREMIKCKVQDNAMLTAKTVAAELSEGAEAEIIQVIGSKFVLYKRLPKDNIYTLE